MVNYGEPCCGASCLLAGPDTLLLVRGCYQSSIIFNFAAHFKQASDKSCRFRKLKSVETVDFLVVLCHSISSNSLIIALCSLLSRAPYYWRSCSNALGYNITLAMEAVL